MQQLVAAFVSKLQQANPQAIANTLWAVATMRQRVTEQQVQQLVAALVSKLEQANPQDVANTLWAVATMELQVSGQQAQQLVAALVSKLQHANPQDVANMLWAVSVIAECMPDQEQQQALLVTDTQLAALEGHLAAQLQAATPREVANTLLACGRLRCVPQQLLSALESQTAVLLRQQTASMNSQALANSAWACGLLGYSSAQLPGVWLQQGVRLLQQGQQHSFGTQDCSNLCWAAVVLDLRRHVPDVLQLAAACSPLWDSMEAEDLQQLYQAHLWLLDCQLPSAGQGLAGCLTRQQLQQCQHSWEQQLATKTAQPSQLQRSVFAALQRLPGSTWQQAPAMEQRTPDGAYSIDITAVMAAGGLQLAVEVEGPWHFLRQPRRAADGRTRCRNRALAAATAWSAYRTGSETRGQPVVRANGSSSSSSSSSTCSTSCRLLLLQMGRQHLASHRRSKCSSVAALRHDCNAAAVAARCPVCAAHQAAAAGWWRCCCCGWR
jgi:hypothetical protein